MPSYTFTGSSQLQSGEYDDTSGAMTLVFRGGATYRYKNVPQALWEGLVAAESAGAYFHRQIKGNFGYEKV